MLRFVRRSLAATFVVAYLALTAWYFTRHALGDSSAHTFGYFWTWDMFPTYRTESTERLVVGRTRADRWIRLLPGPLDRFRWGVEGRSTRYDLDARTVHLRAAIGQALDDHAGSDPDDTIVELFVVERYRPAKFNLPDDLYEAEYGEPNPHRSYWRVLDEARVAGDGVIDWREP